MTIEGEDLLNAKFEDVENLLRSRYNVVATVPLAEGKSFGFGKVDGEWRLFVHRVHSKTKDEQRQALTSCSRFERYACVILLDALEQALIAATRENTQKVCESLHVINIFLTKQR